MASESSGRARETQLEGFPQPSVAVDIAVCSVVPDDEGAPRFSILLIKRETATHHHEWSLPGSFVRERERLTDAVQRTLLDKCGIKGLAPTQLAVLDDPDRDDRGWAISVAHLDTVPIDSAPALGSGPGIAWAPVRHDGESATQSSRLELPEDQRQLPFDHDEIVDLAISDMRRRYGGDKPDPAGLLPAKFTVRDLRLCHEAVLGQPLQKDTFRRAAAPKLEQQRDYDEGTIGRPARLYSPRREPDELDGEAPRE